jgi:hypothetical protein
MARVIKVSYADRVEKRKELRERGYISATALYGLKPDELKAQFNITKLPDANFLREELEESCIILQYPNNKNSYWYIKNDVQFAFEDMKVFKKDDTKSFWQNFISWFLS